MTEPIYNSRDPRCKSPYGAAASGTLVLLTLRPPRRRAIPALCSPRGSRPGRTRYAPVPMPWSGLDGDRDLFSCVLDTGDYVGLVWYTFTLERLDGKKSQQLGPYQLTVYDGGEEVPAWFGEGMTYQIFPDPLPPYPGPQARWAGGRGAGSTPPGRRSRSTADRNGEIRNRDFFGGDLRGVMEKLDYLHGLGVTTPLLLPHL